MSESRIESTALLLRVALGAVMLAHGMAKIFVFTVPGTIGFFEAVGFPGILVYPVIAVEVIGGTLLIVGFQTRWAALAMIPVLAGATSVHWGNGWVFNAPNGG